MNTLKSQNVVIESPMSFTGSAKRLWRLTDIDNVYMKWLLAVPLALGFIGLAFSGILVWYMMFGVLLIPYRLLRRSQRKNKRDALRHRELLESRR